MQRDVARVLANSIVEDAPIRLTAGEWAAFRLYLIAKFEHTRLPNNHEIEIDNSWMGGSPA